MLLKSLITINTCRVFPKKKKNYNNFFSSLFCLCKCKTCIRIYEFEIYFPFNVFSLKNIGNKWSLTLNILTFILLTRYNHTDNITQLGIKSKHYHIDYDIFLYYLVTNRLSIEIVDNYNVYWNFNRHCW